jgi:hypothetical protein
MKRAILAVAFAVLGTTGALAQWRDYRGFNYWYGGESCWSASQRAQDFERAVWRDGRVSKDEWRILAALRARADRACARYRWRPY